MDTALPTIPFASLMIAFAPSIMLVCILWRWQVSPWEAAYANLRMLGQLLLVGYVLTFVFTTDQPLVVAAVFILMMCVAAWIAMRPIARKGVKPYLIVLTAVGVNGLLMLALVTQAVLDCARARFVDIGVSATRERSGVLVMVSLSERRCAVVADLGVISRVPKAEWTAAVARVDATISEHGVDEAGLDALCAAVVSLGDTLEEPMPRGEDDINELEDVA